MEKATLKQINYLKVLGAKEEELKDLTIREASIMIYKLKSKKADKKVKKEVKKEIEVLHSLKVGDILETSWGYDQTNINLFVVTELVGKQSVRIKECHLKVKSENATCSMARDISFDTSEYAIAERSIFVSKEEQEGKGMLKQVKGTKENPYIKIESFAYAYKYNGEQLYESWYA